ncbi:MFS transporter [Candidatus Enterococcus ferrettii]|uniref:Major facilitator superfamily (MFS) profile domain-containing protein n=1 Tax=Candidatus Enterococcus ferrettii TaxID=2815324 RepID=A0ABV0ERU7_9ENTE|nr:MFS transporter [Enterococcus sp. 665A]MBO1342909.1 MFS transporter [Enterococcus sp. 665A]
MDKQNRLLILLLTVGVFGILNTEMGIVGILPQIAEQFHVSVPTAGWLVSGFALVVAFAGPTMPLLFSKVNRKTVMLLALGIFTVSNVISMFATNFTILLLARIIPAAFHPIYVSMAMTVAGTSVPPEQSAKAVSKVFIGVSAGMVLGVPVTSFIATETSFMMAMLFFAAVNAVVFIATIFVIPSMPVKETLSYGKQLGVLKKPIMIFSILIVVFLNGAIFGFYSYLSDFLGNVTDISVRTISLVLLFYGLANIVGNVIAGRILTIDPRRSTFVLPFTLFATYLLLFVFGHLSLMTTLIVALIGVLAGVNSNVNQYLISEAGSEAPDFSNGLYLTAANLGTTFGTFFCGFFITEMGTQYSLFGTLIFVVLGLVSIILRMYLQKGTVSNVDLKG